MRPRYFALFICACAFSSRPAPDAGSPSLVGCSDCYAVRVSAGAFHTCAVLGRPSTTASSVYCFGRNHGGQLGDGVPRTEASPYPRALSTLSADTAAGSIVSCAVDARGSTRTEIVCSGTNVSGVMGEDADATTAERSHSRPSLSDMRITLGAAHLVAHYSTSVTIFGDDHFGQRGNIATDVLFEPSPPRSSVGEALAADAGGAATCIVGVEGGVLCAGVLALSAAQLSTEAPAVANALASDGFERVPDLPDGFYTSVSVGMSHGCAIDEDGALFCFGSNVAGESGRVDPESPGGARPVPLAARATMVSCGGGYDVRVETPLRFTLTPIGAGHTCALTEDGALYCWGANDRGQLGDGTRRSTPVPQRVPIAFPAQLSAGGAHTCAIDRAGALYCWGDNTYGQLGVPPEEIAYSDFPILVGFASPIVERH